MVVVESIIHFSSIVLGAELHIYTDHLNNTVMTDVLKYPDKILRMLLKVESMVKPFWRFHPGRMQAISDAFSRDVENRDSVRAAAEAAIDMPRTLQEAFAMVSGSRASDHVDDSDAICFQRRHLQHTACSSLAVDETGTHMTCIEAWKTCVYHRKIVLKPAKTMRDFTGDSTLRVAAYLPSYTEDTDDENVYSNFSCTGNRVHIRVEAVLEPTRRCEISAHRWLEPYAEPPWTKQGRRRCRLTLFDGILEALRAITTLAVPAVIGHCEGALVLIGLSASEIRRQAYQDRHVSIVERESLEATVAGMSHILLYAPHGFPVRSYVNFLFDYMPEYVSVMPDTNIQIIVVAPTNDPVGTTSRALAACVQGAMLHDVAFPGPAYRTVPDRLHMDTLLLEPCERVMPSSESKHVFVELTCHDTYLAAEHLRLGFVSRLYSDAPGPANLTNAQVRAKLENDIKERRVHAVHLCFDSSTFIIIQHEGGTRTAIQLEGSSHEPAVKKANELAAIVIHVMCSCLQHGVLVSALVPRISRFFNLPLVAHIMRHPLVLVVDFDSCAWG